MRGRPAPRSSFSLVMKVPVGEGRLWVSTHSSAVPPLPPSPGEGRGHTPARQLKAEACLFGE